MLSTLTRATRDARRLTWNEQSTLPVPDTVQEPLPAITKPVVAVVLFAERSTAVSWSAERVLTEEREGPLITAQTVFVPAVVEMVPVRDVPLSL